MMVRLILGVIILLGSMVANIVLAVSAAADAGVSFWEYAMLNKLGVFVLIWNYSPVALIGLIVAVIVGGVLVKWPSRADTYIRRSRARV